MKSTNLALGNVWCFSKFNMIAGGVGITPFLQICNHIFSNEADSTEILLLYIADWEEHVVMKDLFQEWTEKHGDQFRISFLFTREPFHQNKIWKEEFAATLLAPNPDTTCTFLAGPLGLLENRCLPVLLDLGHTHETVCEL